MSGAEGTNNGWPIVDGDQVTRVYVGHDVDGCTFLSGDVAHLFAWFFDELHREVEPVTMLNGWRSRQYNAEHGGAVGSNHMSGTAGDVNGYKHPYEAHTKPWSSGWTSAQQQQVRAIMASTGGLLAWGLDYAPGWRDAMHFDLTPYATPKRVRAFVATLAPTPAPDPVPEPQEEPVFKLYRITDDGTGRVFLGGPGTWNVVPNGNALAVLIDTYGPLVDVPVAVAATLGDTFVPGAGS